MYIFGKERTRRELDARAGFAENLFGIRRFRLREGRSEGVEIAEVRTGSGLNYQVNLSRALDIGLAEFCGTPLSWHSVNGPVHPAYFDDDEAEWLRTAAGGLLMTCGLTQVGAPNTDEGEELGVHGRIHHLPAQLISAEGNWQGDDYFIRIRGEIVQTKMFTETIRLTREITSKMGENKIKIQDTVENIGFSSVPHMILYHFNFGFPLMDEDTQIIFPSQKVTPREPDLPLEGYDRWQAPEVGYAERVYYHSDLERDNAFKTEVKIVNPNFPVNVDSGKFPLAVTLRWDVRQLPRLVQWKMPGAGLYALGIEPANCHVAGRAAEREAGMLQFLEPGEKREYLLEMEIGEG
ncbi:DUF4432 domain-containing protein [candidate division KSB1 bacterium 4484_87]|nr:MAG: DUF4432 domain-containing protein [candidate division KSB1 bacterium 4484_87]